MSDAWWRSALVALALLALGACADGRPAGSCGLIGEMMVRDVEPVEDGYRFRMGAEEWQDLTGLSFDGQDSATVFMATNEISGLVILDECFEAETGNEETEAEDPLDSIENFDPDNDPMRRLRDSGFFDSEDETDG